MCGISGYITPITASPYPSLQVSDDGIRVSKERDRRAGNVPDSAETVPDEVGPRGSDAPFAVTVDGVHHAPSPAHVRVGAHVRHGRGKRCAMRSPLSH